MFGTNWVIWLTVRPRLEVEVFVLVLDCHIQRCSRLLEILFICKKKKKICNNNFVWRKHTVAQIMSSKISTTTSVYSNFTIVMFRHL